jgi:VIT1/CCC1 family predicted Fe2+/Mn2+ transporter
MIKNSEIYIRNITFGITDSLVSTVALLAGIDMSGTTRHIVIMTGIVYAFVEAFSMAIGSFLSEESTEEYVMKGEVPKTNAFMSGIIMFISFVLSSFIPIIPYIFFSFNIAFMFSILFSIIALFIVGMIAAKISNVNIIKHGLKMVLLGGMAIIIGVFVGKFLKVA